MFIKYPEKLTFIILKALESLLILGQLVQARQGLHFLENVQHSPQSVLHRVQANKFTHYTNFFLPSVTHAQPPELMREILENVAGQTLSGTLFLG